MDDLLTTLDGYITNINDKLQVQKRTIATNKDQLLGKLQQVVEQLNNLKNNPGLTIIPRLRQEIDKTSADLAKTKQVLSQLQTSNEELNKQIKGKDKEIEELTRTNGAKDKQLSDATQQLNDLNESKKNAESKLAENNRRINELVAKLEEINKSLAEQIRLIDENTTGLNNDNFETSFNSITANIKEIIKIIGNNGSNTGAGAGAGAVYNMNRPKTPLIASRNFIPHASRQINPIAPQPNLQSNPQTPDDDDTPPESYGGKRKRKTMKKRKMKKMKGGYIYSTSKELDNASSVISNATKTKSRTKSKSKYKTSRKSTK